MEVKALVKQTDIPAFPAFAFWFLPDFSIAQFQLLHCLMCFNIFWSILAISSWKLPAWVSSWPRYLGWVPKGDFTIHASWLLNFTNTSFVDLKTFFCKSSAVQAGDLTPRPCRSPGAQMCKSFHGGLWNSAPLKLQSPACHQLIQLHLSNFPVIYHEATRGNLGRRLRLESNSNFWMAENCIQFGLVSAV